MKDPIDLLAPVSLLVEEAGRMLAAEFSRPTGPRGQGGTAAIDMEIEAFLRPALLALHDARYIGEETGTTGTGTDCWLVDPHDGTSAFLQGHRGTAISVALLRDGVPVLGVVHAPMPPDRGPDTIAWASGMPAILRNGIAVDRLPDSGLHPGAIVFTNHSSAQHPVATAASVAPARFVALPGIAYRLARAAAGDGVAALSTNAPCGWDYAGGHALLIGAGGIFLDEAGQHITYTADGHSTASACFGGSPKAARELARTAGDPARAAHPRMAPRVKLSWPRPPAGQALDRAQGCLFGQLIGDSLGSLVEFRTAASIAAQYPLGVRDLNDGGTYDTMAGQATDDSELALALARVLATGDQFDDEALADAYGAWTASNPFDIGGTTRRGLGAASRVPTGKAAASRKAADPKTPSNGSLMRVSPIGIWAANAAEAADVARRDSLLSHPHPDCLAACAAFTAAIWTAIDGGSTAAMQAAATSACDSPGAANALARAAEGVFPTDYQTQQGWVLVALQNAFAHLARTDNPAEAFVQTVGRGGDTDTNGAIAGALLGAAFGRDAFPARWRLTVMACRPHAAMGARQPRPPIYWPDDLPALAEALLIRRLRHAR
jgi:ADP-ribosyl-[dinitrogen reductase] hydrolase